MKTANNPLFICTAIYKIDATFIFMPDYRQRTATPLRNIQLPNVDDILDDVVLCLHIPLIVQQCIYAVEHRLLYNICY